MNLIGIPAADIRGAGLERFLAEFTEGGRFTVGDIIDQIAARDRQCWAVMDGTVRAVALTRITTDRLKTCHITHLTGSGLKEWANAFDMIEQWARSLGCAKIEATARPGYERVGKRYGLKKTHVLLEKELT